MKWQTLTGLPAVRSGWLRTNILEPTLILPIVDYYDLSPSTGQVAHSLRSGRLNALHVLSALTAVVGQKRPDLRLGTTSCCFSVLCCPKVGKP